MSELDISKLNHARDSYRRFIDLTSEGKLNFRLTPKAEATPYARCFAIFGLQLLGIKEILSDGSDLWAGAIRFDLDRVRTERVTAGANLAIDKPYLQLLTFSLSALAILGRLDSDPLSDHVLPVLSDKIDLDIERSGALRGTARSGNQAMFMAILLIHARDRLGIADGGRIARWQALHLDAINEFGFWGKSAGMTYLQFQNGYHQYEILEYLHAAVPLWSTAAAHVASLADADGHFAPYPGGGGCYDYDAIFMITGAGQASIDLHRDLLLKTANSIFAEQNQDGGFCESHCIRPRSLVNVARMWSHVTASGGGARYERLRYGLTLLRPRHNRIHTHWSHYSREWGESDLWDSWFRMLTMARIDVALDSARSTHWGFINYPGIGFHPSVHNSAKV